MASMMTGSVTIGATRVLPKSLHPLDGPGGWADRIAPAERAWRLVAATMTRPGYLAPTTVRAGAGST